MNDWCIFSLTGGKTRAWQPQASEQAALGTAVAAIHNELREDYSITLAPVDNGWMVIGRPLRDGYPKQYSMIVYVLKAEEGSA